MAHDLIRFMFNVLLCILFSVVFAIGQKSQIKDFQMITRVSLLMMSQRYNKNVSLAIGHDIGKSLVRSDLWEFFCAKNVSCACPSPSRCIT